jgi:beta-xylosidase
VEGKNPALESEPRPIHASLTPPNPRYQLPTLVDALDKGDFSNSFGEMLRPYFLHHRELLGDMA